MAYTHPCHLGLGVGVALVDQLALELLDDLLLALAVARVRLFLLLPLLHAAPQWTAPAHVFDMGGSLWSSMCHMDKHPIQCGQCEGYSCDSCSATLAVKAHPSE